MLFKLTSLQKIFTLILTTVAIGCVDFNPAMADEAARVMEVQILDENGQPLEGANLKVSIWDMPGERDFPTTDYRTDTQGVAKVAIPRRLQILRLWPSKPGYVPEFLNFARFTHDEGKNIPDRYEFRLAKGTLLSGTVVDEGGEPIEGARVGAQVLASSPTWGTDPTPMISTYLSYSGAKTDVSGHWEINNAPAPVEGQDYEFKLKVTHPDFVGDTQWGELQNKQAITTEHLRDGTATLVLVGGGTLTGSVVDAEGKPITEGSVYWHIETWGDSSNFKVPLDDQGRFTTPPLPLGERSIYVVAPGQPPTCHTVTISTGENRTHLQLSPPKQLTVRIVGPDNRPVPKAMFYVERWRDAEDESNGGHTSVLDSHAPRRGDEEGLYVWKGVPTGAVTYRIGSKKYQGSTVTLYATEGEHIVRLRPRLIASGQVTDASTGEPIKVFRVMPVRIRNNGTQSVRLYDLINGSDGHYEVELSENSNRNYRYGLRVEAAGYRSMLSEKDFREEDGKVTLDIKLEPAAARKGRVLGLDGTPVENATVIEVSPSNTPSIHNGKLDWGGQPTTTDKKGRFQSPATAEPVLLIVTHKQGYAEVPRSPNEPIGDIRLQAWAQVSGQLMQDGKPVADESVSLYPLLKGDSVQPRYQSSWQTQTDATGKFDFPRVPPLALAVRAYLGPWQDSRLTSSLSVPLDLKPGEKRSVSLGGEGTTVTGTVVATGRDHTPLDKHWSINFLISRDRRVNPASSDQLSQQGFDPNAPLEISSTLHPAFRNWRSSQEHYFVKLTPDGQLHVTGVPTGTYDLLLQLYEQPAGCLIEAVGKKVVRVEVSKADVAAGNLNLGDIKIPCRAGPRPGEDMRAYQFIDASGREQSIHTMKGQFVLMHVWASWCAPCLKSLPDMRATVNRLSDQPITFVALNVDEDKAAGRSAAERGEWRWAQNYLGDDSDLVRQLAISSVPTYYLIDPEGKLVVSSGKWIEIKNQLEEALQLRN